MSDRYAVFGNPVSHSRSPDIHHAFAAQRGEDLVYERIEAPVDGFPAAVAAFFDAGGRGANVTVPFKEQAFDLCERLTERARQAGATLTLPTVANKYISGGSGCQAMQGSWHKEAALNEKARLMERARLMYIQLRDQRPGITRLPHELGKNPALEPLLRIGNRPPHLHCATAQSQPPSACRSHSVGRGRFVEVTT